MAVRGSKREIAVSNRGTSIRINPKLPAVLTKERCYSFKTGFRVSSSVDQPVNPGGYQNATLREFKISARSTGGNAGIARGCRDTFTLDSFGDFRSFWFVWC